MLSHLDVNIEISDVRVRKDSLPLTVNTGLVIDTASQYVLWGNRGGTEGIINHLVTDLSLAIYPKTHNQRSHLAENIFD